MYRPSFENWESEVVFGLFQDKRLEKEQIQELPFFEWFMCDLTVAQAIEMGTREILAGSSPCLLRK